MYSGLPQIIMLISIFPIQYITFLTDCKEYPLKTVENTAILVYNRLVIENICLLLQLLESVKLIIYFSEKSRDNALVYAFQVFKLLTHRVQLICAHPPGPLPKGKGETSGD